jgi:hypothetical protein
MKKIDDALAAATSAGVIDKKALAIKVAAMVTVTAAAIFGTVLVQNAINSDSKDPE